MLPREVAREIVRIVMSDDQCRQRLTGTATAWEKRQMLQGQLRNWRNLAADIGHDVAHPSNIATNMWGHLKENGWPYYDVEQSTRTGNELCVGLSSAVIHALGHWQHSPVLCANLAPKKSPVENVRNDTGEGHYAPRITMKDGTQYSFDWWLTLDIRDPMIWHYEDWRRLFHPAVLNRGVLFTEMPEMMGDHFGHVVNRTIPNY